MCVCVCVCVCACVCARACVCVRACVCALNEQVSCPTTDQPRTRSSEECMHLSVPLRVSVQHHLPLLHESLNHPVFRGQVSIVLPNAAIKEPIALDGDNKTKCHCDSCSNPPLPRRAIPSPVWATHAEYLMSRRCTGLEDSAVSSPCGTLCTPSAVSASAAEIGDSRQW